MIRLRILIILLSSLMVMSSCSRQYGHLTRRTKGTPVVAKKTERQTTKHRKVEVQNTEDQADVQDVESVDFTFQTTTETTDKQSVDQKVASDASNQPISQKKLEELVKESSGTSELKKENLLTSRGPLKDIKEVNKLRKEVKSRMDNDEVSDDIGGLLYIILVVILVLLILSLLDVFFGGWLMRLIFLILLIILVLYLLGKL